VHANDVTLKYWFGSDIIYAISIGHCHCISLLFWIWWYHGDTIFWDILQYNGACFSNKLAMFCVVLFLFVGYLY